jgi:hypothetical protein
MQFLRDYRYAIPDADLLDAVWDNQIQPFLLALFDGGAPPAPEAPEPFVRLRAHMQSRTRAAGAEATRVAVAQLSSEGFLSSQSREPLAAVACRYCLDAGAKHVLVGMRRPEYVAELTPLFAHAS